MAWEHGKPGQRGGGGGVVEDWHERREARVRHLRHVGGQWRWLAMEVVVVVGMVAAVAVVVMVVVGPAAPGRWRALPAGPLAEVRRGHLVTQDTQMHA